jgi:hypothetical protein
VIVRRILHALDRNSELRAIVREHVEVMDLNGSATSGEIEAIIVPFGPCHCKAVG